FANFVSNQHGINSEISELHKKVDLLLRNLGKGIPNVSQVSHNTCSMCGDPSHSVNNCQSWGTPSNDESSYQQRPQQYQNHNQGLSNGQQSNVDQRFDLILSELANSNQGANLKFKSLSKSVVNLERQMGQLAEEVHKREAGKLPSYPTLNPKHKPVDFVTDDEIVVEGKKDDNMKFDSDLVNDLLKDFPKPPTQNPKATKSPNVGGVLSTTTPYPRALENSASARLAKKGPHSEDMWETFKQIPRGIFEDVIVKVDDFYYPVDFFVMDIESPYKDVQPNIILERLFLATIDVRINYRTGAMDIAFGNRKLRLNVFNSLNSPISNDCYHIDTIDECIQTHTPSMNLDRTLENLHYVDSKKELFDGMTFHEKEEEFQMIEEEFLLSLEETPLQSQQVQQPTLNEVQEYVDCVLVHQDVLLRARGSNKGNGCVRKISQKKMVCIRLRRKHRRIRVKIKKGNFLRIKNKKVDELFALDRITQMVASFLKTYSGNVHGKHSDHQTTIKSLSTELCWADDDKVSASQEATRGL
nr:hypothetical protein [Tanacetum cinerariifolium]